MSQDIAGLSIPIEASTALLRQQMEAAAQVVGGSTASIDRSLGKVDKAFDRLDQASKAVKRAMGGVQKEMAAAASGLVNSADTIDRRLGVLGKEANTKSRAADIEAWGRELDRLEGKFDPAATAAKRYEAELADLADAQRAGIVTGDAYARELQRIADAHDPATIAARKLREDAEKEAASFRVLEDRLDRTGAAYRRTAEEQAKLDRALADQRITPERHSALTTALQGPDPKAKLASDWDALIAAEGIKEQERIAQTKAQVAANWEAQLATDAWGAAEAKAKLSSEWEGMLAVEAMAQKERIAQTKAQVAANWEAQLAQEEMDAPTRYQGTVLSLDKDAADAKKYADALGKLRADAAAAGVSVEQLASAEKKLAAAMDPVVLAAKKEEDALRSMIGGLDRGFFASENLAKQQALLNRAMTEGVGGIRLSTQQHAALSKVMQDQHAVATRGATGTKLAAHEMTNLTYQIQDTFVSLAGGQNPLMVLMQQGPQATGAVGGVGRALSLLVTPAGIATIAVASVAGAVALVTAASEKHQKSVMAVTTSTRLMGDAAGLSASALERMAERGAASGHITVAAAREQESAYIRTGKIGAETMERLIGLSRDYAAATEQDAAAAKSDLAGLFADPVAGAERLQAAYGILTAKEMEHVRQLKATGREEEARVVVADKLAVRVRGLADNTTSFAQAWERVGRAVSNAFDAVGKAASPETNQGAIQRLEDERRRLIAARSLDRARIDGETGGIDWDQVDWSAQPTRFMNTVPTDDRYSAPGTGTAAITRLALVEAELQRRRAAEARAREHAAIRKDTRDRDQFQAEAADITRAARPLGVQIEGVTEKVTKLRRAFGPGMDGASDDTKRALGGFEAQLADLRTAERQGVDLDAYKRKKLADADKQAAGMVGPARDKFLARQRQEIELFGTATTAAERKTQVDAAGTAVTNSQTQAVAQQNAQTSAAIAGAVASADAHRESMAAGIEADARRQAQSEAVTAAIDVEARTRQLVVEKAGQEAVTLAQTTTQLDLETEAQRAVVAATDDGVAARMEAERAAQVAQTTSVALAAAQAAEKAGNTELADKLRALAAGYDAASRKALDLSKIDALKQYNRQQEDGLELARKEAALVGASADDRTRAMAAYQAEVQIRQKGIDVGKTLSAEQQVQVDRTRQLAVETADWQIATAHAQDAWKGVGDAIDNAVVRPLEAAVDAIVKGQAETIKWGDLLKGAVASMAGDAFKLGIVNPAKNALGFEHSASLWDLPMLGGSGPPQTVRNKDGSVSMAPASQGVGGSWLSQPAYSWGSGPTPRQMDGIDDVGQLGYAPGAGTASSASWGQVIAGLGGIAAGVTMATQKGATLGQQVGGGLMGVGGAIMLIPGGQVAGGVMMAAGALLSAVTGAQDRGTAYSRSNIALGANGRYGLGTSAADNDGNPTQFNTDAAKVAKGLNDIMARLNLTAGAGSSFIDTKNKTAEQAALELLKGMQSAVPNVAYALAHETSVSLEDALQHLEFANSFDRQIEGLRSSLSDLFQQFQTGVDAANSFGGEMLKVIDNARTVFAVGAGGALPGFATGTPSAPSGWAVVGEEGPELVNLRGGERIWNARESAQMIAGLGQGRDDTLIHLRSTDELAAVRRALGARGKVNPVTGLLGFDDSGDGVGSDNGYGGENGGERDTPGSGSSTGEYGGMGGDGSGGIGGMLDAISDALDAVNNAVSEVTGLPSHETSALVGMVGVLGTGVIGAMNAAAGFLGGLAEAAFGPGDAGHVSGPGNPGGNGSAESDARVIDLFARLRDVLVADPTGQAATDVVGAARVGDPTTGGVSVAELAADPSKIFGFRVGDVASALGELDAAAQRFMAETGAIPEILQRALDGANAQASAAGITTATATRQAEEQRAREQADALQTQFDGVGLVRSRVSELNDIVKSLADNTFNPVGKDFDALALDMKRAATAYTAAGQAVPDALIGATRQMEALGAVRKRLLDEVAGVAVESSPEQQRVAQISGQWSAEATDLVAAFNSVGIAGAELTAQLNRGLTNALNRERTDYSDTSAATLRRARGEEGYDSAVAVADAYETAILDVNALWAEGADRTRETGVVTATLNENLLALVRSGGITSASLTALQAVYADQPAVLAGVTAALTELNSVAATQQAASRRDGLVAVETALDSSYRPNVDTQLTIAGLGPASIEALRGVFQIVENGSASAAQLRAALTALDGQLSAGAITGDQYRNSVSALTSSYQAGQQAAQALASYQSDIQARTLTAVGNLRGAGLTTLDDQQAAALADARRAGRDTTQLQQVQASERATQAFRLAQADWVGALDQQISAQQDIAQGLQDGAVALAQVARQFREARASLRISEDAPISPQERLDEALRQWDAALVTARSSSATKEDKDAARQTLLQLGPTLVNIEKTNSAGTARGLYDRVDAVFAEFGDSTALGVDTAERQLETANNTLRELQRTRTEAANMDQRSYGALTDLRSIAEQSRAGMLAALAPLQNITGTTNNTPHYAAPAAVQTAWDGLSGAQQHGVARAMGWGGGLDEAFNVWLATDTGRASTFGADVTAIAGGQRYGSPEDIQRGWDALSSAQQMAAVRSAGYDGGIDGGLNAWVSLGHQSAFEAAVRAQAHSAQVPGFATGGFHAGGLRVVGERGPEIEATGASRIWTADQIATAVSAARGDLGPTVVGFLPSALGGGSGVAALLAATEDVGERIGGLLAELQAGNHDAAMQRARMTGDLTNRLERVESGLADLPRRLAGALE